MEKATKLITLLKHPLTILILASIFVCIMLSYYLYSLQSEKPLPEVQQPTIVLSPTEEPEDQIDAFPIPAFTKEEINYPESIPQLFPEFDNTHSGSLVIASDPVRVSVVLKATDDDGDYQVINTVTPLRASGIPVGEYILTATAQGYEQLELPVQIFEAEVNRINLKLKPKN